MTDSSYLLVPLCKGGSGTGHLRRMIELYKNLKKSSVCSLYITEGKLTDTFSSLVEKNVDNNDLKYNLDENREYWDFIILDYRETPVVLFNKLNRAGRIIGIDEGGALRARFPFLIDILPSMSPVKSNISSVGLLNLPQRYGYTGKKGEYNNILISFGGEDPKNLTSLFLDFIGDNNIFSNKNITVVAGRRFLREEWKGRVTFLVDPENLKGLLYSYDLVITSFGLTPFEALASGVPFFLFNPSPYHEKLSDYCGFPSIGAETPDFRKLKAFLRGNTDFKRLQEKFIPVKRESLADVIGSIKKYNNFCPVCRNVNSDNKVIYRTTEGTYYRCQGCGIIYFVPMVHTKNSYKKEYFFEEYKKQYGRTYLDDFETIRKFAAERLKVIKKIEGNLSGKPLLLDVGCAYGPFLAEADVFGYTPEGVELIPHASEYVMDVLGFPVYNTPFEEFENSNSYDLLTMWYVIEHFSDLKSVLIRVNNILKKGGLFAFSTPCSSGISGKKNLDAFLEISPSDHLTVWNPQVAGKIMPLFGFRIRKIRVTGHHPERFPYFRFLKIIFGEKGLGFISRIFGLGDTFEVYAEKIKDYNG